MKDKALKCCLKQGDEGVHTIQLVLYYKFYTTCCNVWKAFYIYNTQGIKQQQYCQKHLGSSYKIYFWKFYFLLCQNLCLADLTML